MLPEVYSVAGRVRQYGPIVRMRLKRDFEKIVISYPPKRLCFIGLKDEKILEVWAADENGAFKHLKDYPILGTSGKQGPKLKEGDRQVPEGLYKIDSLNPNSRFHLSLRINYPNAFDTKRAAAEGHTNLGGDIMIHGGNSSIGCLAMGDEAAEDLFILAAETGIENISIIFCPIDFRVRELDEDTETLDQWTKQLYTDIKVELFKFRHE
jgi:murein L,D-transpeptidase YafK